MKQSIFKLFFLFISCATIWAQSNIEDALNFRDEFDTKKLYNLKNNFDGSHKLTLIDFYEHFANCVIAEDILSENKLKDISKENLVSLIDENISGWESNLLMYNSKDLDSINLNLNKLSYNDYIYQLVQSTYSYTLFSSFKPLEDGSYLLLINMASMGASNNYTLITKNDYGYNEYSTNDLDNMLYRESILLSKKLNGEYTPSFSRHGASITTINGKKYYKIFFSERNDAGCCPSAIVAIPSFSNDNYYDLDSFYAKNDREDENKPIDWKKLN